MAERETQSLDSEMGVAAGLILVLQGRDRGSLEHVG